MNAEDFWKPWEVTVSTWDEVLEHIEGIHQKWPDRTFAWRGQVDASWPLHSSHYRRLLWTHPGTVPDEKAFQVAEHEVLVSVHRWGLHHANFGRLSILHQLAMLQHYGAPTRLIDITFNPSIGLWFAVEKKWDNGQPKYEDKDARLFAIDVTDRLINEKKNLRPWEDDLVVPWKNLKTKAAKRWKSQTYAWKPPQVERRIAAQNGGFLLSGIPSATDENGHANLWPKGVATGTWWHIEDVRKSTSLALRPHKLPTDGGTVAERAVFSMRIKATAKSDFRNRLETLYGYKHLTIYPDYTGFASFATPELKSRP